MRVPPGKHASQLFNELHAAIEALDAARSAGQAVRIPVRFGNGGARNGLLIKFTGNRVDRSQPKEEED